MGSFYLLKVVLYKDLQSDRQRLVSTYFHHGLSHSVSKDSFVKTKIGLRFCSSVIPRFLRHSISDRIQCYRIFVKFVISWRVSEVSQVETCYIKESLENFYVTDFYVEVLLLVKLFCINLYSVNLQPSINGFYQ